MKSLEIECVECGFINDVDDVVYDDYTEVFEYDLLGTQYLINLNMCFWKCKACNEDNDISQDTLDPSGFNYALRCIFKNIKNRKKEG